MQVNMSSSGAEAQVQRAIAEQVRRVELSIVREMERVGEESLNRIKRSHDYKTQTGKLESSTGYNIVWDGKVVSSRGFDRKLATPESDAGIMEGKALADELARRYTQGIVLIMVAGAEYAAYVDAMGYDVITSGFLWAERRLPQRMEALKRQLNG